MQFKKALLPLLLPLLVAACDSNQPTYSASNANSAPPPAVQPQTPPPPPTPVPAAAPAPEPAHVAAAPAPPPSPVRPTWRDQHGPERWTQAPAGKMAPVEKIGVGSCDDYVERYRTCFNTTNLTREQKQPLRRTLTDQLRAWKTDTAAGKISQVAASCSAADQTARVEFRKVGCTAF
jgi:hypothetical protein